MKIKKEEYYGFNHESIKEFFEGSPEFVNEFDIPIRGYLPWAVYFCPKPNRKKGHKDYVMFKVHNGRNVVTGMDKDEIEPYRWRNALYCQKCDTLIFSFYRHNMVWCTCEDIAIDGGCDYTKVSVKTDAKIKHARIDLLTDTVTFDERKEK